MTFVLILPTFIFKILFKICDLAEATEPTFFLIFNHVNKQMFHVFLFNIRNYSPEVINIQRRQAECGVEYYIIEGE